MVYPGTIPSPGANNTTTYTQDDYSSQDLGSLIESFQSPGGDRNILAGVAGKRDHSKFTAATPQRQVFGPLTNRTSAGGARNEFTPLLKSVHRSQMKSKVNGGVPMPEFLKPGARIGSSPMLPMGTPGGGAGDSTYRTEGEEDETISPALGLPDSSVGSTPMGPRGGGGDAGGGGAGHVAPLGGDGLMTLREQEKVIDEIKKENFGLKLKVFFLNERLEKLGPEHNDAALKENVEIKVERATLKAELKRYKKSLLDAEKAIAEMREDMMNNQKDSNNKYTNDRIREEEARLREGLHAKLNDTQAELEQVMYELDEVRDKAERYRVRVAELEAGDGHNAEKLRQEIDKLEDEKGDLEAELREKEREIDKHEDQLDTAEEEFKRKEDRISRLEEHAGELQGRIDELEEQRDQQVGGQNEALKQKEEALRAAERRIKELERASKELQSRAEDDKEQTTRAMQRVEVQNTQLKENNAKLKGDLEKLRDDAQNKSFSYRGRLERGGDELKNLRAELEGIKTHYKDLDVVHQAKVEENQRLQKRIESLNSDFDVEVDEMQAETNRLKLDKESLAKARYELEARLQKALDEIRSLEQEKDTSARTRGELEQKAKTLQDEIGWLKRDKENLAKARGGLEAGVQGMQDEITRLKREKESIANSRNNFESELKKARGDLHHVTSEKDLLRVRHDALTEESSDLQTQIERLRKSLQDANATLHLEKESAISGERSLRQQFDEERHQLEDEVHRLELKLKDDEMRHDRDIDSRISEKRQLEVRLQRAEESAEGLRRTLQSLQQTEHTLQGKETKFAEALKNESERHRIAEEGLQRQVTELQGEIEARRHDLGTKISELNATKEEAHKLQKSERILQDKIKSLDDEVDVLTVQLEEAHDEAKEQVRSIHAEAESLRQKLKETKLEITRLENQNAYAQADLRTFQGDLKADAQTQKQLQHDVEEATRRFQDVNKEKLQIQEQLAAVQSQLNSLRIHSADVEAERDEIKSRLSQSSKHDVAKGSNSERIELRKTKGKLEIELQHAEEERDILEQKVDELEVELEDTLQAAREQEEKAWALAQELKKLSDAREREQQKNQQKIARLEVRIDELVKQGSHDSDAEAELMSLRGRLDDARNRELELSQKEVAIKKEHRELRHRVNILEQELQDTRNAAALAQSSVASSPRSANKGVEQELRKQLSSAQEQIREHRSMAKAMDRKFSEQKNVKDEMAHELRLLDQEIQEIRQSNDSLVQKNLDATGTIGELRKKVHSLERELHEAQFNKHLKNSEVTTQTQIVEERQELHEHLRSATQELEQLQSQVRFRDEQIRDHRKNQRGLEEQLRNLRKEKSQVNSDVQGELDRITRRYNRIFEKNQQLQQAWDEERKAIKQRVRFSGTSGSRSEEALDRNIEEAEKRHQAEIRGLAKQIRYLKAKVSREASFRNDLAFSKNFFLMQVQLYSSCNQANMQLIEQMGIFPDRYIREKRPAFKSVVKAVIATIRMRKSKESWGAAKELRESLARSLQQTRSASGLSSAGMPRSVVA